MRFKLFILSLFCLATVTATAQNQIVGKWLSADKKGVTEIYKKNGKFYGKIVWLKEPNENGKPVTDKENPEASLRSKPIMGLLILKDFYYEDGEWTGGTIYDPNNGKTYDCTMWLTDNNHLQVRGYWGIFYRTESWTRRK